ncbi:MULTISPECIES: hypothetical protein [Mesorhizobium]|uniref:hypothetical protein n=1 Tax=Mesorhizobium sp. TaxID=1871066 RepID=UPI00068F2F16|nr:MULTISPECIES: hypothetical protein [Mesorhizobium]RWM72792.1 MAG: hypothetical protein EOR82_11575 [Mesorhizobium sp.]TIO23026.1 MAG: hypothetical protein E5X83_23385 [Mesorhizobium sp.]TJV55464.1 MAG: hypothetical protein E5X82_27450 [Mesorhizobium sp.]
MITGKPISRYATRNTPGALLDPTLDAASDIFQVATGAVAAGDFERSDLHTVRKLLGAQLFWLRTHFDRVEKATGDTMGLPEKRSLPAVDVGAIFTGALP